MAWKRAINIHTGKPKWGPTDFPSSRLSAQLPLLTISPGAAYSPHIIMGLHKALSLGLPWWGDMDEEWEEETSLRLAASWHSSERGCPALPTICLEVSCMKTGTVNANNPCRLCQGHNWDTRLLQCSHIRAHAVYQSVVAARNTNGREILIIYYTMWISDTLTQHNILSKTFVRNCNILKVFSSRFS